MNVKIINYRNTATIYYSAHGETLRISTGVKVNKSSDIDKNGEFKKEFLNEPSLLSKIKRIDNFISDYIIKNNIDPTINLVKIHLNEEKKEALKRNTPFLELYEEFFNEKKVEFSNKDKSIKSLKDYKSLWNSFIDYESKIYKEICLNLPCRGNGVLTFSVFSQFD